MSIQEARRVAFEGWVTVNWPGERLGKFSNGEYQGFTVQHCWTAWNAALDSVVVDLPIEADFAASDDAQFILGQCREAIEAAGISVEVKS